MKLRKSNYNKLRQVFEKQNQLNKDQIRKTHVTQKPSITIPDKKLNNKSFSITSPLNIQKEDKSPTIEKPCSLKVRTKMPFGKTYTKYSSITSKVHSKNESSLINSKPKVNDKLKELNRTFMNFSNTIGNSKNDIEKRWKRFSKINNEHLFRKKTADNINKMHNKINNDNIENSMSKKNNTNNTNNIRNSINNNANCNNNNKLDEKNSMNSKISYSTNNTNNINNNPIGRKSTKNKKYNQKAKNFIISSNIKNNNNSIKTFLNLKKNEFTFGRLHNLQKIIKKESVVKELCK